MVSPWSEAAEPRESVGEIIDRLLAPETPPTPDPAANNSSYVNIGNGVFDRLTEHATWSDILEPAGWTQVRPPDSRTLEAWRRPGGTHPVSAKVLKDAPYAFVIWSEDAGLPSGPDQKLTKGRVYAHLNYGAMSRLPQALTRGDAVRLPAAVIDATTVKNTTSTNVTEVSAAELSGAEGTETPSSWRPVDLTSVLDGTWQPPQPSVGRRTHGKGLFYPGRTHTVVSETEAGKTWFALAASIHEMAAGCHVLHRFRG